MKKTYYLQLYTGNFQKASYTGEAIIEQLQKILNKIPVKSVLLGWCTDYALNMKIVDYLHAQSIACYLWFPILSEIDELVETKDAQNMDGTTSSPYPSHNDEEFSFLCPNSYVNYHSVIDLYETYFKDIPFDGVFLDKLRYATFVNGYQEGFGCLCEACSFYHKQHHVDIDALKTAIENRDPMLLKGEYDKHGVYHFEDKNIHQFYENRSLLISDYVFKLATYFNSRKISVGADVYAPFFAYHCGQKIKDLATMVDFIKPMIYKNTNAPAGMKFEYDAYLKNFKCTGAFTKHWNNNPCSIESIKKQCSFLNDLPANIIPGIEVTTLKNICDPSFASLKEAITTLESENIHTFTLSWNIMEMKDELLEALAFL